MYVSFKISDGSNKMFSSSSKKAQRTSRDNGGCFRGHGSAGDLGTSSLAPSNINLSREMGVFAEYEDFLTTLLPSLTTK